MNRKTTMAEQTNSSPLTDDPSKIALGSTLLNVGVATAKGLLAWLSGSSALLADMIHGLSDTMASLLVVVGIRLSKKKSKDFPWGLYKVENFVALVSAMLIFFAGYEIALYAFQKESPLEVAYLYPSILVLSGIILAIVFFSRYERNRAKALHSPSLLADASHWQSDIASTAIVLLALFGSRMGYPLIDRLAALGMVAFIGKAGWDILKDSMRTLLDASVSPDTLQQIREVIRRSGPVKEIRSLQARNSGRYIFVHVSLTLRTKSLAQAHRWSEGIENAVRQDIPWVDRMMIHYEPESKDSYQVAVPIADDRQSISDHFGEAPYFCLLQIKIPEERLVEESTLANPFTREEKGKGIKVGEWLVDQGADIVMTRKPFEGRGPSYVFSSAEVAVVRTDLKKIEEVRKYPPPWPVPPSNDPTEGKGV